MSGSCVGGNALLLSEVKGQNGKTGLSTSFDCWAPGCTSFNADSRFSLLERLPCFVWTLSLRQLTVSLMRYQHRCPAHWPTRWRHGADDCSARLTHAPLVWAIGLWEKPTLLITLSVFIVTTTWRCKDTKITSKNSHVIKENADNHFSHCLCFIFIL